MNNQKPAKLGMIHQVGRIQALIAETVRGVEHLVGPTTIDPLRKTPIQSSFSTRSR